MPAERVTIGFRPGDLLPKLEERAVSGATTTSVSKRDLERLYDILPLELRAARLDRPAALQLLELYRRAWPRGIDAPVIALLDAAVAQRLAPDGGGPLVEQLRALSPAQRLAVVDAVERAIGLVDNGQEANAALQAVGLV